MKIIFTITVFITAMAASPSWTQKTNIYEKEEATMQSFTAKVKSVREAEDGVDVTFESDVATGFYSLSRKKLKNYDEFYKCLEKSKKPNGLHVKVSAEKDDKIIHSVSLAEKIEKAEAKKDLNSQVDAEMDKIMGGKKGN